MNAIKPGKVTSIYKSQCFSSLCAFGYVYLLVNVNYFSLPPKSTLVSSLSACMLRVKVFPAESIGLDCLFC